jgi:hypothetical protein
LHFIPSGIVIDIHSDRAKSSDFIIIPDLKVKVKYLKAMRFIAH